MRRLSLLALLLVGCYKPNITDGKFTCALTELCPSGYSCKEGRCVAPDSTYDLGVVVDIYSGKLGDLDLSGKTGTLTIDTETGRWLLDTTEILAAATAGWKHVPQTGGPPASVFPFRSLYLPSTITVVSANKPSPSALVLTAQQTIQFDAMLDWTGFGPAGAEVREPAGHSTSGTGGGMTAKMTGFPGGGGGGAGHATMGQPGTGVNRAAGGPTYGSSSLNPLEFGAGGGGGGGIEVIDSDGRGGGGGPAVALITAGTILFGGTIDVSGGKGHDIAASDTLDSGGGGGGSGGSILLSAAQISFGATHKLHSGGGAGGAPSNMGGTGGAGAAGRIFVVTPTATYVTGVSPQSDPAAVLSTGPPLVGFPQ